MKYIRRKTKDRFKKSVKNLVSGLSREVIVYSRDLRSECPNCYYDKVSGKSSGIYKAGGSKYFAVGRCPVCRGKGVITTSRKRAIKGLVIWNPRGEALNVSTFTEAGMGGATKVEIKTDPRYLDLIKDCKHVVIDGITCKFAGPPIIRGLGNKALLISSFFTDDKLGMDSGERL